DGGLQGLLAVLDLGDGGCGSRARAIWGEEVATKTGLGARGLPLAAEVLLPEDAPIDSAALIATLGPNMVVKPPAGGSAIGVSRLLEGFSQAELEGAVALAREQGPVVLIERYVRGLELTCGVLEGEDGPVALPPTLISAQASDWYDFESKYSDRGRRHNSPAQLERGQLLRVHMLV